MSKAGSRILKSARQALAYAKGEADKGFVAHVPDEVDVKLVRQTLNLTQEQFATRFGFTLTSIRDWEQRRFVPERPARVLLKLIQREPKLISRVLATPEPRTTKKGRHQARA